ncbi:MAG: TIGR01212 family radical SAM protein [Eubacteriaceae bacterium]|uniref:TIGR01212 family radical SAM protein n=1 Tax=Candidatus Pseudoramibacter fermentans TaxID=2594427 RepID=A0A6L5GQ09_9FIRM|nr:TIGR01212 family radical SAM protein [Candidatus Pseudoramibacter fermentans]RRF92578.1 MAG: TIGR01212 family radical SAM protein [Eubacteriaceae bacterium]
MKILTLSEALKRRYHTKVYKLSLSSGCTCPNRDGTLGTGGCTFCSAGGSGDFAADPAPLGEQLAAAKALVDPKFPKGIAPEDRRYIAYFQSYTNTYVRSGAELARLRALYREAIARPEIVGLAVGTRPDCLPDPVLDMLADLNRVKPVWVELGLQTVHEATAEAFHRGYPLEVFESAYRRLADAGIPAVVHVILGLPGETRAMMLETVDYLSTLSPTLPGIKLQLLHVLKGTAMGEAYLKDPFPVFTLEAYTDLVVDCLKRLPESTVVHRLTGDAPKKLLIAPKWSANKRLVLNTLRAKIARAERPSSE